MCSDPKNVDTARKAESNARLWELQQRAQKAATKPQPKPTVKEPDKGERV